jgi:hypothetical protein
MGTLLGEFSGSSSLMVVYPYATQYLADTCG